MSEKSETKEEAPAPEEKPQKTSPPNHIFIGKKPIMSYALSAMMQLTQFEEIVLRARGRAISRAVDVAQVITKRLGNDQYDIKDIKIDTEPVGEGDQVRNVSTIEIVIGKK